MEENNFKRLMMQEELDNPPPKEIEENIFKNLHIFELLGETMELFIPSAAELFVDMLGGAVENRELETIPSTLVGGLSENDNEEAPKGSSDKDE